MIRQTDHAYQFLKEKILDGTYKPTQRLTEIELSETIQVSRNTIKKALLMLEQENLVQLEANKGAFIKSFTLEEIVNYLEIREVLEGLVAKTAAINITKSELNKMELTLKTMRDRLQNQRFDEYSSLNKDFHAIIYRSSKNPQAVEIINMIKNQLLRYQFRTVLVPGRAENSYKEHSDIFHAFKSHDSDGAAEAVRFHVSNVRRTIENNFSFLM